MRFLVARDGEGKALATGALVLHDGWAEIKRMWVEEAARGRGIAREILNALMVEASNAGVEILRLETGVASHAALALYEKTGFKRRSESSRCFGLTLDRGSASRPLSEAAKFAI